MMEWQQENARTDRETWIATNGATTYELAFDDRGTDDDHGWYLTTLTVDEDGNTVVIDSCVLDATNPDDVDAAQSEVCLYLGL